MAKEKQVEVLSNGRQVTTSPLGWGKEADKDGNLKIEGVSVLCEGWMPGSPAHTTPGFGLLLAIAKKKIPNVYVGEYEAPDGTMIPVVDCGPMFEEMWDLYCQKYGLVIEKPQKLAGNKSAASAQLSATLQWLKDNHPEQFEEMQKALRK